MVVGHLKPPAAGEDKQPDNGFNVGRFGSSVYRCFIVVFEKTNKCPGTHVSAWPGRCLESRYQDVRTNKSKASKSC